MPVTNEEMLEAEKLIADMRRMLDILRGTADVEKLISLARDEWSQWIRSLGRLYQLGAVSDDEIMTLRMDSFWVVAVGLERFPDLKQTFPDLVAKEALSVDGILKQSAESLRHR